MPTGKPFTRAKSTQCCIPGCRLMTFRRTPPVCQTHYNMIRREALRHSKPADVK